jgi:peptidyl-prolyl cis-trans isomerase C
MTRLFQFLRFFLVATCFCLAIPRSVDAAESLFPDPVLARGQGFEIRESQLAEAFVQFRAALAARGRPLAQEERTPAESALLDRLIVVQVLLLRGKDSDRARARATSDRAYEDARSQATSDEAFRRRLTAMGTTPEKFRQRLFDQAILEDVVEREVHATVEVSAEAVRKYYDENPKQFERPELVRVRHLLLGTFDRATGRELPASEREQKRALIDKLLVRAREKEDFAQLVKDFTDDAPSRDRGGEYLFARATDNPAMAAVPEFERVAFALKPGELSDVVTTRYGFHVIQLLEKLPPQKLDFAAAEADIRKLLQRQEGRKRLPAYFDGVRKDAGVEILEPRLRDSKRLEHEADLLE